MLTCRESHMRAGVGAYICFLIGLASYAGNFHSLGERQAGEGLSAQFAMFPSPGTAAGSLSSPPPAPVLTPLPSPPHFFCSCLRGKVSASPDSHDQCGVTVRGAVGLCPWLQIWSVEKHELSNSDTTTDTSASRS